MAEPATSITTVCGAAWHQRAEFARLLDALARLLAQQRRRGRTAAADPVGGFVIEDGEAEGLVAELESHLAAREREHSGLRAPNDAAGPGGAAVLDGTRREIAERADAGAAGGMFLPLRHAARAFALSPAEYDALLLALCVEQDARFARLVAYLNDHAGRTRPTIGLVLALAGLQGVPAPDPVHLLQRPLVRDGLVETDGDGPLPSLALKLPRAVLGRLAETGESPAAHAPGAAHGIEVRGPEPGLLDRLVLADERRERLRAWARALGRPSVRHSDEASTGGGPHDRPITDERGGRRAGRPAPNAADAPMVAGGDDGPRALRLVLSGAPGAGRRTAAHAIASAAGLPLVVVDVTADVLAETVRAARREARWHGAALLLRLPDRTDAARPDPRALWSELDDLEGPVLVSCSPPAARELVAARAQPPALLGMEAPDADARVRLWKTALPAASGIDAGCLAALATRFRFTPGGITLAARRALAEAAATTRDGGLTCASLERACRDEAASGIGALAQKLPLPYRRDDLVVPPEIATELDLALAWVRQERTVLDTWGFRRRLVLGRGLTALFAGPPGTGKTMAAQVLARELGLDLFRVDLSRVMSKFIGETEKNLAALFDHAASAVLFFDEADALFGKRSEVKDAHDRYANVEIGYLLQRMEEHEGVTVLASNRVRDMDEAFVRRFHVIAHFPMPTEADRLRIWHGMFPPEAPRAADLDLPRLAREFEVSGGEIKNAALAAAYLAADAGAPIGMAHVTRAIRREIVKSGRVG